MSECSATCGVEGVQSGIYAITTPASNGGAECALEAGKLLTQPCVDMPPCPFKLELRILGDFDAITRDTFIRDFEADMSNALSTSVSVLNLRWGSIIVGFSVTPTAELADLNAVVAELDAQMTTQGSKLWQGTVTDDVDTSVSATAFTGVADDGGALVGNVRENPVTLTGDEPGSDSTLPIGAIAGGVGGVIVIVAVLLVLRRCKRKKSASDADADARKQRKQERYSAAASAAAKPDGLIASLQASKSSKNVSAETEGLVQVVVASGAATTLSSGGESNSESDGTISSSKPPIYLSAGSNGGVQRQSTLGNWNESFEIKASQLELGEVIGNGGFGEVLAGKYLKAPVAIKRLHSRLSMNAIKEMQAEASVMSKLHSPFIVQLFGVCYDKPHYLVVMELMPSGSLFGMLSNDDIAMSWTMRLRLASDIASGVFFLHSQDPVILHRDLKSLNVLITNDNCGKLTDFGLAQARTETQSTQTSVKGVGSVPWMAPELFARKALYGPPSDVYALAWVLYELASRKLPFAGAASPALIIGWVKDGERDPIPSDTPPAFARLIKQCWHQTPAQRPSASTIVDAIDAICLANPSSVSLPAASAPQVSAVHETGPMYASSAGSLYD
jgi:serine/threonine protein kinase